MVLKKDIVAAAFVLVFNLYFALIVVFISVAIFI